MKRSLKVSAKSYLYGNVTLTLSQVIPKTRFFLVTKLAPTKSSLLIKQMASFSGRNKIEFLQNFAIWCPSKRNSIKSDLRLNLPFVGIVTEQDDDLSSKVCASLDRRAPTEMFP